MSKSSTYICIICGSKHGEPTESDSENWYWKRVQYGRIGPFCSEAHCNLVHITEDTARFTLEEWERLRFYRECARSEYAERIFS
jgi:hypothetical protein